MQRLTREQSAVISAFTGILAGPFEAMQEYAERLMGRPIFTHEFASLELSKQLKVLSKADFISLTYEGNDHE